MDGIVHGVAKSQTGLSDFHFHFVGGGVVHPRDYGPGKGSWFWPHQHLQRQCQDDESCREGALHDPWVISNSLPALSGQ